MSLLCPWRSQRATMAKRLNRALIAESKVLIVRTHHTVCPVRSKDPTRSLKAHLCWNKCCSKTNSTALPAMSFYQHWNQHWNQYHPQGRSHCNKLIFREKTRSFYKDSIVLKALTRWWRRRTKLNVYSNIKQTTAWALSLTLRGLGTRTYGTRGSSRHKVSIRVRVRAKECERLKSSSIPPFK